jgi:regulator of nucleoside diphosphate kinase
MNHPNIYLSASDHRLLSQLLAAIGTKHGSSDRLRMELTRAIVLDPAAVPTNAVGLYSCVDVADLDTGERESYVLTLPAAADPELQRISVLAPVGTALLGYREGDEVEWPTPGGLRRLKLLRVIRDARARVAGQPAPTPPQ